MSNDNPIPEQEFTPLDSSELNDMRRRIVAGEEVSDDELKHGIQTLLYLSREKDLQRAAPKKKAASKPPPDVNFDDLLNNPL